MKDLERSVLEMATARIMEIGRNSAASLVDPITGQHQIVYAWETGPGNVTISTSGSDEFAVALERRLVEQGVEQVADRGTDRLVYLAHGSEDHEAARRLAEALMAAGIEVWLDKWEIAAGDSIRRRMEEGLGACTDFVVLLTATSIGKPWVLEEVDAAFVRKVEGECRFVPLRVGLPLSSLSPFLRSMHVPEYLEDDPNAQKSLIDTILGVSAKPQRGDKPKYVRRVESLSEYSAAAVAVAKIFVEGSPGAMPHDFSMNFGQLVDQTGISADDVEIAVLDLVEAGLIKEDKYLGHPTEIFPCAPLFIVFDHSVMGWSPTEDARQIAVLMINEAKDAWLPSEIEERTGWSPRRLNAAFHAIDKANLAEVDTFFDGQDKYVVSLLRPTTQTKRIARES